MSHESNWRRELAAALSFITRVPVPWTWCDGADMGRASRWFSTIGILIGLWSWLWLWALAPLLGQPLAAVLAVIATIVFTGALHQDGLADLCDGFWGGWERERKLAIMKDSQIGSYGVLALIAAFSLSVLAITSLPMAAALPVLLLAHTGSRAVAGLVPKLLSYARLEGPSKTPQANKPIAGDHLLTLWSPPVLMLIYGASAGLGALFWPLVIGWAVSLGAMLWLMKRHIQGYTGDTLGATQQVVEIVTLLIAVAVLGS